VKGMAEYLLAHDLGTSGNKATLYTTDGDLLESAVYSYALQVSNGNWAEQNADDWWKAVCETTRQLTQNIDTSKIVAISFSGQMMGCLCVDRCGKPIRNSLIWADMRSTEQEREIRARIDESLFYHITGHRISSSYSATKLMWLKDHEPDTYKKTYKMLNAKDYIVFKLTGNFITEPSDASSTCLMDLNTLKWSDELFELCGLDESKMPELAKSADIAGKVSAEAAACTGLMEGTPVVCGGGDGVCAAVGTGIIHEGIANCCLGTSSWISMATQKPIYDDSMTTFNFAHIVPGYVMPCGTMQYGGGSLSWAVKELYHFEAAEKKIDKKNLYDTVCQAVEKSPAGAKSLLFLPYLIGERSPRWNDKAKGVFLGLTLEHTRDDMLRAVMEGVALNLDIILRAFLKSGVGIEKLILIGGGARNAVWRQILADIFGIPILKPNYLEEATSMGAAITAGVGAGAFSGFDAIDRFLKKDSLHMPNSQNSECYARLKALFDESYYALEKIFGKL